MTIQGRITDGGCAADPAKAAGIAGIRVMLEDGSYAVTDRDGRYEFLNVSAGRYGVSPTKEGYVFVSENPFDGGRGIELADGEVSDRHDFVLSRGSVITGRITDEFGEPVANVMVQAARYQFRPSGARQLVMGSTGNYYSPAATNDRGEYRMPGMEPGRYYITANYGGCAVLDTKVIGDTTNGPVGTAQIDTPSNCPVGQGSGAARWFKFGTQVSITAKKAADSKLRFLGWGGTGVTGIDRYNETLKFTLNSTTTATASFGSNANCRPLTITVAPAGSLTLVVMATLVKELGTTLPAMEILFFRSLIGFCFVLPLFRRNPLEPLRTKRPGMHLVRGALGA